MVMDSSNSLSTHSTETQETPRKSPKPNPLERRRRAKHRATKAPAPVEATITQLTNTVGDAHLFNATKSKTKLTNPLERRRILFDIFAHESSSCFRISTLPSYVLTKACMLWPSHRLLTHSDQYLLKPFRCSRLAQTRPHRQWLWTCLNVQP